MIALLAALSYAQAADLRVCTDLGPLVAADADGSLSGTLGPWRVQGTEAKLQVVEGGGTVRYEGPLAALNPRPVPDLIGAEGFALQVIGAYDVVGEPLACPLAGPGTVRVGHWPEAVALPAGHWVAAVADSDLLVRSTEGVAWLHDVAMGPAMAGDVAAELAALFPKHRSAVIAKGGRVLVVVQQGTTIDTAAIGPAATASADPALSVVPLLRPPRALVAPDRHERVVPAAAGGTLEMLAEVNAFRHDAGLPPFEVSPGLNWAALAHCAYLDWAAREGRQLGHVQDADSPVFLGATPAERQLGNEVIGERFGSSETIAHQPDLLPWESVSAWVAAPFHRSPLLDPRQGAVGACATPAGARVMEIEFAGPRPTAPFAWPTDGQRGVPVQFDGREDPDPIPADEHPDRVAPMGIPLTVWLPYASDHVTEASGWLKGPEGDVPVWVVAPSTHAALAGTPKAELHLVPKRPLAPGTTYSWAVQWKGSVPAAKKKPATDVSGEWKGSFTTVPAVETPAPPLGAAEPLAKQIDAQRAAKGLPALVHDHDASVAAAMAREGATGSATSILQAESWTWACFTDAQIAGLARGGNVPEALIDPRMTRAGYSAAKNRVCVVTASTELRPPAWDPRQP